MPKPVLNARKKLPRSQFIGLLTTHPAMAPATTAITAGSQIGDIVAMFATREVRNSTSFSSQGVRYFHPSHAPNTGKASRGKGGAVSFFRGRSKRAVNAGLNVSELNAEIMVLTAIVNANWRKKAPVIPEMNAQGTNTALSTRPTAITGPETWCIASIVASRGAK